MSFKVHTLAALTAGASALAGAAAAQDDMMPMIMVQGVTASSNQIIVPEVMVDEPGFIVVHRMEDGAPVVPQSIGHAYVDAGTSDDVVIDLDEPLMADEQYTLMLHYDTDGDGTYSFGEGMTDVDTPVVMDGAPVTTVFATAADALGEVEAAVAEAAGTVVEGVQDVAEGVAEGVEGVAEDVAAGVDAAAEEIDDLDAPMIMADGATAGGMAVTVPQVWIDEPGFLVVHEMVDGEPVVPQSIGHTALVAGMNEDVTVSIGEEFSADEQYMLMLHYDTDGDGVYSFGEGMTDVDTPVTDDGAPVTVTFQPSM
ncbi:DUF7282 domain-containing protein [Pseudoroseicyclus tamaricis]|uniref:DUF7282 domain-containing protein n=1 Tax=Pseudoroseicyclus tamaricis TaxID=2705421 RepID=A0A6B2JJY5_9RHOB|nr:hypothetical protein [Pseudoroseicyclus tamaricis]NDV01753.1 hypothetical protein [Pseudoroseicyclus tamaricis]